MIIFAVLVRHVNKMLKMPNINKVQVKRDSCYIENLAHFEVLS